MTLSIRTGIEIELWVTDERGELADGRVIADTHPRIEPEFIPSLLEVKTEPHKTEAGLRADLFSILRTAVGNAAEHDLRLVPLGTPLTDGQMDATTARGRLFEEIYGEGVIPAKNAAGSHIHFEKSAVARQLNLLTAMDPALALVSSSPYYRGKRNENCSRAVAYRSDCGQEFRQFCELMGYVDDVAEWEARVETMYDDFFVLAERNGVSRERVTAEFCAENTALNPVRLHQKQPTVEWRAPDSALPSQILRLAVDMGNLVAQTTSKPVEYGTVGVSDEQIGVPAFDTLRKFSHLATKNGHTSPPVERYLRAFGFDVDQYDPVSARIQGPEQLSHSAARRLRLQQSKRLALDVSRRSSHALADTALKPSGAVRL